MSIGTQLNFAAYQVQEIMRSDRASYVFAYELQQLPANVMRRMFTEQELRLLQHYRYGESPQQWQQVFDPIEPTWAVSRMPSSQTRMYGVVSTYDSKIQFYSVGLHWSYWAAIFYRCLEYELVLIDQTLDSLNLVQHLIILGTGGIVLREWKAKELPKDLPVPSNCSPIQSLVVLGFETFSARHHAMWLLAHTRIMVGIMNYHQLC